MDLVPRRCRPGPGRAGAAPRVARPAIRPGPARPPTAGPIPGRDRPRALLHRGGPGRPFAFRARAWSRSSPAGAPRADPVEPRVPTRNCVPGLVLGRGPRTGLPVQRGPTARSCWPCGWGAGSPTGSISSPPATTGSGYRPTRPHIPRWSSWNTSDSPARPRARRGRPLGRTMRSCSENALAAVGPGVLRRAAVDDNEWAWAGPLFVRRPARGGRP